MNESLTHKLNDVPFHSCDFIKIKKKNIKRALLYKVLYKTKGAYISSIAITVLMAIRLFLNENQTTSSSVCVLSHLSIVPLMKPWENNKLVFTSPSRLLV